VFVHSQHTELNLTLCQIHTGRYVAILQLSREAEIEERAETRRIQRGDGREERERRDGREEMGGEGEGGREGA
jgi:hypothetical protein